MSVTSTDYFKINGISSHNYGLYVDTPPMAAMSERSTSVIDIADREETLYINRDNYADMPVSIKTYTFEKDFDIQRVYSWLKFAETLSFGDENAYYRVKALKGITPNYQGHGKNIITITFICSPFKYYLNDDKITKTTASFSISNTGNYWCRPKYKIFGSGDITITAKSGNDAQAITISNVSDHCILDCERLISYKETTSSGVTTRTAVHTSGVFPLLKVGTTNFTVTGTVSKIEINRNMRNV